MQTRMQSTITLIPSFPVDVQNMPDYPAWSTFAREQWFHRSMIAKTIGYVPHELM